VKYLFFCGVDGLNGRLRLIPESELKALHYQEVLHLCMMSLLHQKIILMNDSSVSVDKCYYGKPVVKEIEKSFEFVERAFPDIRAIMRNMLGGKKKN
jgi:hypothetical protein